MSEDKKPKRNRAVVRAVRLTPKEDEALSRVAKAMKMNVSKLIRHQLQPIFDHIRKAS